MELPQNTTHSPKDSGSKTKILSYSKMNQHGTVKQSDQLVDSSLPATLLVPTESGTYDRNLASSRALSVEPPTSSSLTMDKSSGSTRLKAHKKSITESGLTKLSARHHSPSPLTSTVPDRTGTLKSTSYIDIHQKSSRQGGHALRCASSMTGKRATFDPICKATREASQSQPDELYNDSSLVRYCKC
ncbi:unnamed protein product [Echinostoma caproni]|uniref:CKK domain-containing protein n=1 Tax=Echinostoma caproni TaxID=27848 RepID=A0A183AYH4_9TREM|nr:unnamed protein product [Echinostoma caproni]